MDEIRRDAYDSTRIYKEKVKNFHDKSIVREIFEPGQKVRLYNFHLPVFSGKLRSRWIDPYIVCVVYPNGAMEIQNPKNDQTFKLIHNGLNHS